MTNHNIDADEIKKFDQQATQWWDTDGPFKTLHDINPTRLAYITDAVDLAGKRALDVGCGGGVLSEAMAKAGALVTGLDMSPGVLKIAKEHAQQQGLTIDYQQMEIAAFAEQHPGQFDVVTCLEMLEHVPDPEAIVHACAKALKPDGHCFFSTINRNGKSFITAIIGAEYLLNIIPRGTHHYRQFIKPSELQQWCRNAGLRVNDSKGMWYQPFSRQSGLHDDVSVNYLLHALTN